LHKCIQKIQSNCFFIFLWAYVQYKDLSCDVTSSAPLSQEQWPDRRGHLGGVLVSLGASPLHYYLICYYFFLCCRIVNKPEGTWRNGGADGSLVYVLRGIRHIIIGDKQRGAAKVACPRKCRYGPEYGFEFSSRHGGEAPGLNVRKIYIGVIPEVTERKESRRAAKRREGPKVDQRPRGGYPLRPDQPSGSWSARKRRVQRMSR